ncbi:hypothetical protein BN8_00938 [Fibrisoma limi BUZ 3]|uniref:Uncharacterized protein n=1 Tax=Fibrisoma limi BUZ 3 TaxID=1185876 RepID=I2GDK3_9BACT|nr:hypothetical protein BN8_00938 [Fibrisoma limi BUZ 3]
MTNDLPPKKPASLVKTILIGSIIIFGLALLVGLMATFFA